MRRAFHAMDMMLRQPEGQLELLAWKSGANRTTDHATQHLRQVIQTDLDRAKSQGSLSQEQAKEIMMKCCVLKRLDADGRDKQPALATADEVGCTAICVLLSAGAYVCANAGDSRAIVCRAGKPVELSRDHKPNDEVELERIKRAGGYVDEIPVGARVHHRINGNLNLSRAIGDLEYKSRADLAPEEQLVCSTPDIVVERRTDADEFLVLACDGIWDVKTNEAVCEFVSSRLKARLDPTAILEELLAECLADDPKETHGLGGDNMTCILVVLEAGERVEADSRRRQDLETPADSERGQEGCIFSDGV